MSSTASAQFSERLAHLQKSVAAPGLQKKTQPKKSQRAVIVRGARTPFARSFGTLIKQDATSLGVVAVSGLISKTGVKASDVDGLIWGNVVTSAAAPNTAREIIIDANLPRSLPGRSVSVACLSGAQAIYDAVSEIERGDANIIIAGGSDSTSSAEMPLPRHVTHALGIYQYQGSKQGAAGLMNLVKGVGLPSSWMPAAPAIAERSTGKTMGYHADLMCEINEVPRAEQEALAVRSHNRASATVASGAMDDELCPVGKLKYDDNVRSKMNPAKLAKLGPCFRGKREGGSITAATASPLTDGASAVLVMSEDAARERGFPTDVSVAAYALTAVDPYPQLLLAPAFGIPKALERAGIELKDIDIWEVHEAFAGQVLATLYCLDNEKWCRENLGRGALGKVDPVSINLKGSSLAYGHPFSATGGRIVHSATMQLRETPGARYALISICGAGGLGGVMILERQL